MSDYNLKLYKKITHIVDHDRRNTRDYEHQGVVANQSFSFLDQKGPKTLNIINKKHRIEGINHENRKIKQKIETASSSYSLSHLK